MQIEINEEALTYLKGLKSKNKQRKFLLDFMIEQITLGELISFKDGVFKTDNKVIQEILSNHPCFNKTYTESQAVTLDKVEITPFFNDKLKGTGYENCFYELKIPVGTPISESLKAIDEYLKNNKSAKPNYSPEEIDIVKRNIKERGELLKFDQIDKEEKENMFSWYNGEFKKNNAGLSQEKFFDEISNISRLYNVKLIKEWFNYKPQKNTNSEKQFTKEDLEKSFNSARETHHEIVDGALKNKQIYDTFDDYFKTLKNE